MIVRTIEMLLEYICIMLCIYKAARQKIKINSRMCFLFILEWLLIILVDDEIISGIGKAGVYIALLFYIKYEIAENWEKAVKVYGSMIITIVVLQVMLFIVLIHIFPNMQHSGIYINIISCLIILFVKEKLEKFLVERFSSVKGLLLIILIYSMMFFRVFWVYSQTGYVSIEESIRFAVETVVLNILFVLWFHAENMSKQNTKELQMYHLYNKAFEETIQMIRIRQHEFENHINAIKCMRYSINNQEELLLAQENYCNDVLRGSHIEKLLKLSMEPALIGFLYAKITTAEERGVHVEYKIEPIDLGETIKIYEMIELIGVLFDNAIEALEKNENRKIVLMLVNSRDGLMLEIANTSRIYTNNEIEKFCLAGYSTKGERRGIGLARVKEIVKKINAELLIQNQMYDDENYLAFIIQWNK